LCFYFYFSTFLFFHVFIFHQIFFLYQIFFYTNTSAQRHLLSSDVPFKMIENDHYHIPVLSRDNHETWFQDMSFILCGKEIFYVVKITMREYAWIKCDNSTTTSRTKDNKLTSSVESDMDELTSKFEKLGGTYNLKQKRVFKRDQAKAFHIISMSLGEDDKSARGEYEFDIKGFWISLKVKY
jgi:hypothetical protein